MSLTGAPFLALLLALTAVAFLWSAVRAPRRRTVAAVLARLLTQAAVCSLVLLSAGAFLNRQYYWYASWRDLLGWGTPVVQSAHGGASPDEALRQDPGSKPPARRELPPLPSPGQRAQTFTITGTASGLTGTVMVSLPAGYDDPANADRAYPVIEAFHGYPAAPDVWMGGITNLVPSLDVLSGQGRIRDAIVVAPQIEIPNGTDTECVNGGPGQPQIETWLAQDVPEAMSARLRVEKDRASWATVGYSSGGWCAAMVTMLHPDVFGAGVVLGGYMSPIFGNGYVPFHNADAAYQRYRLVTLASTAPPPVALWLQTSKADTLSYTSSTALMHAARPPLSVESQVDLTSGHRMTVWAAAVPAALTWLSSAMQGFHPTLPDTS